ncbi:MAG TPA: hypothetical protein VFW96_02620 [Thermomicrobiales bacterium]|nr:hypothetical protein [Thermomicrobiales bacterium]
MRIDVYAGDLLAASFEYLDLNTFYGALGLRVRELLSAAHPVHNPWTGEDASAPRGWTAD